MITFTRFLLFAIACINAVTRGETLTTGEDVTAFVSSQISDHKIMVFAKSYCPYCKRTKATLRNLEVDLGSNLDVHVIELDEAPEDDGRMIQQELLRLTGQRTVPNVFIDSEHIGGNSDIEEMYDEGTLHDLVKVADL